MLSIYSAATVSFAAFIVLAICFVDDQALFVIPGLDENVTGVGVCAVALVCGGCAALFCSQVLRYELASRIAVFAITNALVAFVLVASFAVLEMTDVGGGSWDFDVAVSYFGGSLPVFAKQLSQGGRKHV